MLEDNVGFPYNEQLNAFLANNLPSGVVLGKGDYEYLTYFLSKKRSVRGAMKLLLTDSQKGDVDFFDKLIDRIVQTTYDKFPQGVTKKDRPQLWKIILEGLKSFPKEIEKRPSIPAPKASSKTQARPSASLKVSNNQDQELTLLKKEFTFLTNEESESTNLKIRDFFYRLESFIKKFPEVDVFEQLGETNIYVYLQESLGDLTLGFNYKSAFLNSLGIPNIFSEYWKYSIEEENMINDVKLMQEMKYQDNATWEAFIHKEFQTVGLGYIENAQKIFMQFDSIFHAFCRFCSHYQTHIGNFTYHMETLHTTICKATEKFIGDYNLREKSYVKEDFINWSKEKYDIYR